MFPVPTETHGLFQPWKYIFCTTVFPVASQAMALVLPFTEFQLAAMFVISKLSTVTSWPVISTIRFRESVGLAFPRLKMGRFHVEEHPATALSHHVWSTP